MILHLQNGFLIKMFQHSFSILKNVCTEFLPAPPWPSGCGSLWPRFHFCYSQPQSVDLGSAEETKRQGEKEERWVIPYFSLHDRKYHAIFGLDWKMHNTTVTERLLDVGVRDKTEAEVCGEEEEKRTRTCHTHGGKHLLTEGRARFTKLLFQCNVCTALFYEKRKVPSERWQDEFQSCVCATTDAHGSIPVQQACSIFIGRKTVNIFVH